MRKTLSTIGLLASLLSLASIGHAQALPTATGQGRMQVGGGFSYAIPNFWTTSIGDPAFANNGIGGITGFANYDLNAHFGAEADFHCLALITALDRAELSFLVGPRVMLHRGRYTLYGKALIGIEDLFIQEQQDNYGVQSGAGSVYAFGGGLDFHYNDRIVIRAFDYESQSWPGYGTSGISPTVITFGVAYRFH